jgi:ERCC4-type nuclease
VHYLQEFRLKKSGIKNVIYLIEETHIKEAIENIGKASIFTAMTTSFITDGFHLKRTASPSDTVSYLAALTLSIEEHYKASGLE